MSTLARYGLLVNWGCSTLPISLTAGQVVLNPQDAVRKAKDKLISFVEFRKAGVPCPPFWDKQQKDSVPRKDIIIARLTTRGSGGEGIVVVRPEDSLPDAPLYTQYIRKVAEYRAHVVRGQVVALQQKRRDSEAEQTADQKLIRNYDNGWVFAINNVEFVNDDQKKNVVDAAISACAALGLDFGAVDLVTCRKTGQAYVLEVNTAPGIESPTLLDAYTKALTSIQGDIKYDVPAQRNRIASGARRARSVGR